MNEHEQRLAKKRDELHHGLAERRGELARAVAEKEKGVTEARHKANEHANSNNNHGAKLSLQQVARFQEEIRVANASIREIDLELGLVLSGMHHELAPLIQCCASATCTAHMNELEAARAEFQALLSPALKAAAQRFVSASKNAAPLMPVPTLAEMLSVTEAGAAHGGAA